MTKGIAESWNDMRFLPAVPDVPGDPVSGLRLIRVSSAVIIIRFIVFMVLINQSHRHLVEWL